VRNELWRQARAVPSLDLRFADNKSLVDATTGQNLVTFTRASSGTYVGSDGLIKTAVTNLLLRSEEFDNASWSKTASSVTANTIVAPNGTVTADKLVEDTSTGGHVLVQGSSGIPDSASVCVSCYCKAAERSWVAITVTDKAAIINRRWFNLSNGTQGATNGTISAFSATNVGDGWYRIAVTASVGTGASTPGVRISLGVADNTASYTGDGTSGIYLWGAQLEQSSTVGEYIPTTSTINSAPRFDHNPTTGESLGLLVEESRTNSLVQSEDFSTTWTQSNVTVTTNTVTAPDGTTTADTFGPVVGDGLTTTRFLRQTPALTTQQAYTLSVFVKVGTATINGIALFVSDQTATNIFRGNFNLFTLGTTAGSTGWATPTSTIIPYPNGWYRCILSGVTSTAHTSLRAIIYLNQFGTTADTYGTIHIWGAQLEAGAFPTSYIPTTTATVTRSADVASITGASFGTTRTNLLLQSEQFNYAAWTKVASTITSNAATAPSGSVTADKIVEGSANTAHYLISSATAMTSGTTYVGSVYAKASERTILQLTFQGATHGSSYYANFDLATGTLGASGGAGLVATITSADNGWYRCSIAAPATTTASGGLVTLLGSNINGGRLMVYTGDGTSGLLLWGAQLEVGSAVTPYIPTTTAAVSVFESSWYRQDEGTVFTSWTAAGFTIRPVTVNDGTGNNAISVATTTTSAGQSIYVSGSFQGTAGITGSYSSGTPYRQASAYRSNDAIDSINGTLGVVDTSCSVPSVTQALIGQGRNGASQPSNGTIRRLTYWPTRLGNEVLQTITQ
jgi:hypothetical protein